MSCICDICENEISHSQNISKHKKTEKCQNIKKLLDKRDNINISKYNLLLNKNDELKEEIINLKNILNEKDIKIKLIEEEYSNFDEFYFFIKKNVN